MNNSINSTISQHTNSSFDLVQWYCILDDFFALIPRSTVGRRPTLSIPEIATIILLGARYECRCMKSLYTLLIERFDGEFTVPAYQNFVRMMNTHAVYCMKVIYLMIQAFQDQRGIITFCDSTKLEVCRIYREHSHKVMKQLATKSKSTTGWFYGMRLHIVSDRRGNLMGLRITTATIGERTVLEDFMQSIHECIIVTDAGYVSKDLITIAQGNINVFLSAVRKNMTTLATQFQNKCMNMRSRIETVFGVMKQRYNLVSSLPRSVSGYLAHYMRSIFAYMLLG